MKLAAKETLTPLCVSAALYSCPNRIREWMDVDKVPDMAKAVSLHSGEGIIPLILIAKRRVTFDLSAFSAKKSPSPQTHLRQVEFLKRVQGDTSGQLKPGVGLNLGCSAIQPGQWVATVTAIRTVGIKSTGGLTDQMFRPVRA